jgi:NADPH-dependent 2,4-dienoyl-CoA reductase/sulfur reductase-like enzyme/nitrite reductase/ring-hydroxylating ferredoxin subunit
MPPSLDALVDLSEPIELDRLQQDQPLHGRVGQTEVLLVRQGDRLCAVSARCTHAGAPLQNGLVHSGKVHCPFHHAAFDLQTGEATLPPALSPLQVFEVKQQGTRAWVTGVAAAPPEPGPICPIAAPPGGSPPAEGPIPASLSIVGAGAAGDAAAAMARQRGFAGTIHLLGSASLGPTDRTKLSKDFLTRGTDSSSLNLRSEAYWEAQRIDLRLGNPVVRIDAAAKQIHFADGAAQAFDKLLLAPGGAPGRPQIPGAEAAHVIRTVQDCLSLQEATPAKTRVGIVGGGFIGMEAAAALRRRGCAVHLISPGKRPLEKVLGDAAAEVMQQLHEAEGVVFHMGRQVSEITEAGVRLDDGSQLALDVVLLAVGIAPRLELAQSAGLRQQDGVLVDAHMRTSHPDIYAAGDIARFVAPYSGESMRLEHWAVAQRQGQIAALAMIGQPQPYDSVPFFWTRHYETSLAYVGHAEGFDATTVFGDLHKKAGAVVYKKAGRPLAVATLGWQKKSLACEAAFAKRQFSEIENILQA